MKKHIDRAILLNPNDADTLANASYLLAIVWRYRHGDCLWRGCCKVESATSDWYPSFLSTTLFSARRYEDAFELRRKMPDYFIDSTFYGAAMLAQLGRVDEARQWAQRAVDRLSRRPGGARQAMKSCVQIMLENNPYRLRPEDQQHFAMHCAKQVFPDNGWGHVQSAAYCGGTRCLTSALPF